MEKRMSMRIVSILTAFCMNFTFVLGSPLRVFADEFSLQSDSSVEETDSVNVVSSDINSWTELVTSIGEGQDCTLAKDVSAGGDHKTATIYGKTAEVNLKGRTITGSANENVFRTQGEQGSISIIDTGIEGRIADCYGILVDAYNGSFVLKSGSIELTEGSDGGIMVSGWSTFTMKGGSVTKSGDTGNAIHIGGGYFDMSGGTVNGSIALANSSILYEKTPYTISGGTINGSVLLTGPGGLELSGDINIDELYLAEGKTFTVGDLGANARIGISTAVRPELEAPVVIAENVSEDCSSHFICTSDDEAVVWKDNKLLLVKHYDTFSSLQAALETGSVKLDTDITADENDGHLSVKSYGHTLDLNGHTLDRAQGESYPDCVISIGLPQTACLFTIKDSSDNGSGKITGARGNSGIYCNDAQFDFEGGSISGNASGNTDGAGVYLGNYSTMTMSGGSITGNSTDSRGGGVYIESGSVFTMNGGSITGNTTGTSLGAGVYVDGTFNVSGNISIKGNTTSDESNRSSNVYLPEGKKINVIDELDEDTRIYVSMAVPGVITNGLKGNGTAANFVSDNTQYSVLINNDGEAVLCEPQENLVWEWNDDYSSVTATMYNKDNTEVIWTETADTTAVKTDDSLIYTGTVTHDGFTYTNEKDCNVEWEWRENYTKATLKCLDGDKTIWSKDTPILEIYIDNDATFKASVVYGGLSFSDEKKGKLSWDWVDDLSSAVLKCTDKTDHTSVLWEMTDDDIGEDFSADMEKYIYTASVSRSGNTFEDTKEFDVTHMTAKQPEVSEDGTYTSGNIEYYSYTLGQTTYYFNKDKVPVDVIFIDWFEFNGDTIVRYKGEYDTVTTSITLPRYYYEDNSSVKTEIKTLGSGSGPIYDGSKSVEMTDSGSITKINALTFQNCSNLTLSLVIKDTEITAETDAFKGCDKENVTVMVYKASKLITCNEYKVAYFDDIIYTVSAEWTDDYRQAKVTLTPDVGTPIPYKNVPVTKTENSDHIFSFTAKVKHGGVFYTASLENISSFRVTFNKTDYYVPKAPDKDYALFTLTNEMYDSVDVPVGAELFVKNGDSDVPRGETTRVIADTTLSTEIHSTWSKVNDALANGAKIELLNDITADEEDSYLHVPEGVSAEISLNGYSIDRALDSAAENGFVIKADGTLKLIGTAPEEPVEKMGRMTDRSKNIIRGGKSSGSGGGIYVSETGNVNAEFVNISGNSSANNGGGIHIENGGHVKFKGGYITGNTANGYGGGVYVSGEMSPSANVLYPLSITATEISDNSASNGGGVYIDGGQVEINEGANVTGNNSSTGTKSNINVSEDAAQAAGTEGVLVPGVAFTKTAIVIVGVAGSSVSIPYWVPAVTAGFLAVFGTMFIYFHDEDSGEDPDRCDHPSWKSDSHEWEEPHYDHVSDNGECTKCHIHELFEHTPTTSVDDEKVTTYTVELCDGTTDTKEVQPYKVILQANFPKDVKVPEGVETEKTLKVEHDHNRGKEYELPENQWKFDDEGLKFKGWYLDDKKVEKVEFKDDSDEQEITVKAEWELPVKYEPGVKKEDDPSLDGKMDDNPVFVEKGKEHKVRENPWTRDDYKGDNWIMSEKVEIEKDGEKYKLKYSYPDKPKDDDKKKKDDKIKIEKPVSFKVNWSTKWAYVGDKLNEKDEDNNYEMSDDVKPIKDDKANEIKKSGTLDLKGKNLDAEPKKNDEDEKIHHFDVSGELTIKNSSDDADGTLKNGKNDENGGSVVIKEGGKVTLESGMITKNSSEKSGGGVYIENGGTFTMSGGRINVNNAGENGGGVYIADGGKFVMNGGEISGCHADGEGGGVYVGGIFEISGKVSIEANTKNVPGNSSEKTAGNVYLPKGKLITVTDKLDKETEIHVWMEEPGVFTSGLYGNDAQHSRGSAINFISDNENYRVVINDVGEAMLTDKAYRIIVDDRITHADIVPDKTHALKDDFVTFTITTDPSYILKKGTLKAEYIENGVVKTLDIIPANTGNTKTYSFKMPGADVAISAEFDVIGARLEGYSLSFDGDIGVNFYMSLDDRIAGSSTAYMQFTRIGIDTKRIFVKDAKQREHDGKTYYVFKYTLNAKEMTDKITAQLIDGEKKGEEYTFSVQDYAQYILEHSDEFPGAEKIVKAMLNYGSYAQLYFLYNTGDLAYSILPKEDRDVSSVTVETLKEYRNIIPDDELPDGVTFEGSVLSLKSKIELQLYFTVQDGKSITFTIDGKTVTPEKKSIYTVVRIKDVKIEDIDTAIPVTVSDGTKSYEVKFHHLNNAYDALSNNQTDDKWDKWLNVIRAMYLFYKAADEYKLGTPEGQQ